MASLYKNEENNLNDSILILTIDIGDGICDKLRIHNINKFEEETYDFCAKNNLDFHTMQEINNQIQKVIKENKIMNNILDPENNKQNYNIQKRSLYEERKNNKNDNINNINEKKNIPNKKNINRYNGNPLSLISKRQKNINKNNSYGIFNNNTRSNTSSSKGSFITHNNKKKNNIVMNVKNAFNAIKKQSNINSKNVSKVIETRDNDSNKNINNINNNDINNLIEYSSNENIYNNNNNKIERLNYNTEEDKFIISNVQEEVKNNHNICTKKRKESIEIINTEEINDDISVNKNEKNKSQINSDNDAIDTNYIQSNKKGNDSNIINKEKIINNNIKDKCLQDKNNIYKSSVNRDKKNRSKSERTTFIRNQELIKSKEKSQDCLKNEEFKNNNSSMTDFPKIKNKINYEYSSEDIIKNYKKYKEEKFKILKEKQEIEFRKIYTFRPNINKSSKLFSNNCKEDYNDEDNFNKRSKSFGRFEKLYNDRISYKENQDKLIEEYEKEFSYKPKLNKNSLFLMNKIPFNERLKIYTNRTKEKINKIQKDLEKNRKINEYFQPKLNSNKNKEFLKERDDIDNQYEKYNKQYLYGQKYEQKKQYLTEKFYEGQFKSPECCPMTNNLYNQKKEKCFKKLFRLLDGDNDGKISYNCMSTKYLPVTIKQILEPIFLELKVENEVLNESEFIFVCEKFYNILKYDQKQKLILFEDEEKKRLKKQKIEKANTNYSFKPKINKHIDLTYGKRYSSLNRVLSYEANINKNNYYKNGVKSIDIKELNYIMRQEEKFRSPNHNNKKNENKKINDNKIVVSNISLCNLIDKKNENKKEPNSLYKESNILVIQNLNNKIDKIISYTNDKINDKIKCK